MSRRRSRAFCRLIGRKRLAEFFLENGTLYREGWDEREAAYIRSNCVRAGIPMGGARLDAAPQVLDAAELAPLYRILFTGTNHW